MTTSPVRPTIDGLRYGKGIGVYAYDGEVDDLDDGWADGVQVHWSTGNEEDDWEEMFGMMDEDGEMNPGGG